MTDQKAAGPTDYLAAERTFLAWIRTGLALMGLGFVVARFGLFLQTLAIAASDPAYRAYGPSFWFGTAFIILGVAVTAGSLWNYFRLVQELQRGGLGFKRHSWLAIAVALTLAAAGLAMAIYLISVRQPASTHSEERKEKAMTSSSDSGIVTLPGKHSVDQTVSTLEETLRAKGVKLFAVIDHSGEAEQAGLQMRPTKLLIFGNPKAGTPLMVASPTIAIDLPLKILVWENSDGRVQISYNSPAYLQARHALPEDLVRNIAVVAALATGAAE
jgi:uncharacterized protein (DUF302 family)/uncharacterized membrane protein YidH (DUF202 family)